jgi:hypothetical protein
MASATAKELDRSLHIFTVPPGLAAETGVKELGIVKLTVGEEVTAAKRTRSQPMKLANELTKFSLRMVNGEPVNMGDGTAEEHWANFDPKVRLLALTAYTELHQPEEDDMDFFLKSRKVKVG